MFTPKWTKELSEAFKKHPNGMSAAVLGNEIGVSLNSAYHIVERFRHFGYPIETRGGLYVDPTGKFERETQSSRRPAKGQAGHFSPLITEPGVSTLRGKVLQALRQAGDPGATMVELTQGSIKKASVQSAIMELRTRGFRIDYTDGRYFFRGVGVSLYKNPRGGKAIEVFGRRSEHKTHKVMTSAPKPSVVDCHDVFVIVPERLQRALEVLPAVTRTGLMELQRKVLDYNKVVRFFIEADKKKDQILTGA